MTIIDQAEQLRQQAISLLLQERETIDQKLNQLGHGEPAETIKGATRKCGKCGSPEHNARTCRTVIPESSPA